MSLPTLAKQWQFDVNKTFTAQGSSDADCKRLLRGIKDSLKGFSSNPWTVVASSNGTTVSTTSDLWVDDPSIVGSASNHSWIVLKQAAISANYQICLDMNSSSGIRYMSIVWSPGAGFSGGTVSARPTASDSITLINQTSWCGGIGSSVQFQAHVMMSTDGQCTRVAIYATSQLQGIWIFDRPNNAVSGWTVPGVALALGYTTPATYNNLLNNTNMSGRVSGPMGIFMTTESYAGGPLGQKNTGAPNDLDGSSPLTPIGLSSETPLMRGRHGTLFDLWFGNASYAEGDTYPNDSTRQFVHFGNLVHPWNGSTVQIV